MGGRGGASGTRGGGSADGVIMSGATRTIETVYREARGWQKSYYKDEGYPAQSNGCKQDGNGNVTFSYAKADSFEKTAKTNRTNYVTYTLKAGAVNGETFNIDWSKVNSISGQTYNLRTAAKNAGLSWDSAEKKWKRKK